MKPELERQTTKDLLLSKGYKPLTKVELLELISNTTVCGDYEYSGHRKYKSFMNANGEMNGKNDWGSYEEGNYTIDEDGHLSVAWDGYWEEWTGVAFKVANEIKFYDTNSGIWRTTFNNITKGEQSLAI